MKPDFDVFVLSMNGSALYCTTQGTLSTKKRDGSCINNIEAFETGGKSFFKARWKNLDVNIPC